MKFALRSWYSVVANKEYTKALIIFSKAYEKNPKDTRILNNLGICYYFKGKRNKAVELIRKAIDLDKKKLMPT